MEREIRIIDITQSKSIEIQISNKFIWVNIDGICRLRASIERCDEFVLKDDRERH